MRKERSLVIESTQSAGKHQQGQQRRYCGMGGGGDGRRETSRGAGDKRGAFT